MGIKGLKRLSTVKLYNYHIGYICSLFPIKQGPVMSDTGAIVDRDVVRLVLAGFCDDLWHFSLVKGNLLLQEM